MSGPSPFVPLQLEMASTREKRSTRILTVLAILLAVEGAILFPIFVFGMPHLLVLPIVLGVSLYRRRARGGVKPLVFVGLLGGLFDIITGATFPIVFFALIFGSVTATICTRLLDVSNKGQRIIVSLIGAAVAIVLSTLPHITVSVIQPLLPTLLFLLLILLFIPEKRQGFLLHAR